MTTATVKNPADATANIKVTPYDPANHQTTGYTLAPGESKTLEVPTGRLELWVGKILGQPDTPQDAEVTNDGTNPIRYTVDGGATWTDIAGAATIVSPLPTVGHYMKIAHV